MSAKPSGSRNDFITVVSSRCRRLEADLRLIVDSPLRCAGRRSRSLREFGDLYTAPVSGFESAEGYYTRCSAAQIIPCILVPTLILTLRDDPLVPVRVFESLAPPAALRLYITASGGHLGYVDPSGTDPDRRWMDWQIIDWLV